MTVLCPATLWSQDSVLEIEVVGRKVDLIGNAVSASEGRVSFREIEQRALLRAGDVLETVPGLVATQHSGSGKANQFFLRGFNLDHGTDFATKLDDMPINMRSHAHGQGYTDLNFIIPEMIQEIIYRKGSYYPDVGDFSGAGSASIYTRSQTTPNRIQLGAGEFGYARALLTGNRESFGGNLTFGFEHQVYEGPWDSVDEDVGKTNIQMKQSWERDSGKFSLSLMAYENKWNSADQIPHRAVRSGLISKFGSIDPTSGGESSRYSLSLALDSDYGAGNLSASLYVIDYDLTLFQNFSYFSNPAGDQITQLDDRKIFGGKAIWSSERSWAGKSVVNRFGVDLRSDDIDQVGFVNSTSRRFASYGRLDAVQEQSAGVYWQNEINWTEQLRSIVGLRHDRFEFDVKALKAARPSTLPDNSGRANDSITTASVSLIYALDSNHELYASLGNGFHSNDARGVLTTRDPFSGMQADSADPLVPTFGAELGWRIYFTDELNTTLALWQLDIDSELLFVGDSGSTEDTGFGSERYGFELTTYYQISDVVGLDFEYAYTESKFSEPVDGSIEIPGALDEVVSVGINYQPNDIFFAHLRLRQFSDYSIAGEVRAEGSSMTNLRFGFDISESIQISLDLLNIFDSDDHDIEYFYESQLLGEQQLVADNHYHVFEPRSARFSFNYRF